MTEVMMHTVYIAISLVTHFCPARVKIIQCHCLFSSLVQVNRVFGWEPEPYYNISEVRGLVEMPQGLRDHIGGYLSLHICRTNIFGLSLLSLAEGTWIKHCKGQGREAEERCPQLRMAWVSCEGDTPHDREFMGRVTYVPKRGMPGYFFPYLNQGGTT